MWIVRLAGRYVVWSLWTFCTQQYSLKFMYIEPKSFWKIKTLGKSLIFLKSIEKNVTWKKVLDSQNGEDFSQRTFLMPNYRTFFRNLFFQRSILAFTTGQVIMYNIHFKIYKYLNQLQCTIFFSNLCTLYTICL